MLIKQLTPRVKPDRIIKLEVLEAMLSAQAYSEQLQLNNAAERQARDEELRQFKLESIKTIRNELVEQNSQQFAILSREIATLLDTLNTQLSPIVYKILNQLGLEELGTNQITTLLNREFNRYLQLPRLTLTCHPAIRAELEQKLRLNACEFAEDANLSQLECICQTPNWTLRVNLHTAQNFIQQLVGSSNEA